MITPLLGLLYTYKFLKPIKHITKTLSSIKNNNLSFSIDTSQIRTKNLLEIALASNSLTQNLKASIMKLQDTSSALIKDATHVDQISNLCDQYANQTLQLITQISIGANTQIQEIQHSIASAHILDNKCEEGLATKRKMLEESKIVAISVEKGIHHIKVLHESIALDHTRFSTLKHCIHEIGKKSNDIQVILKTLQALTSKTKLLEQVNMD